MKNAFQEGFKNGYQNIIIIGSDLYDLQQEDLEKAFVQEALENKMGGLKGHRSVGGCRASIYNPTPVEAVETLCDFMKDFERRNG